MNFIIEHWYEILLACILIAWAGILLYRTKDISKEEQYEQIRGWLFQAVLISPVQSSQM